MSCDECGGGQIAGADCSRIFAQSFSTTVFKLFVCLYVTGIFL